MTSIAPVILCGGLGTRLWPLSRKSFPKQFVPLIDGKSLLQLTLERVAPLGNSVVCVASDEHRFLVAEAVQAAKVQGTVLLEPMPRNTAAAMAIAAFTVKPTDMLLFCPSDHHIPDLQAFVKAVQQGVAAAEQGAIVTFGIAPSFPSTAYGYIRQGSARLGQYCTRLGRVLVHGQHRRPARLGSRQRLCAHAMDDVATRPARRLCDCRRCAIHRAPVHSVQRPRAGIELKFKGEGLNETATVTAVHGDQAPVLKAGDVVLRIDPRYFRPTEVETLLGDPYKAKAKLGWMPEISVQEMCKEIVAEDLAQAKKNSLLKADGYKVNVSLE